MCFGVTAGVAGAGTHAQSRLSPPVSKMASLHFTHYGDDGDGDDYEGSDGEGAEPVDLP